MTPELAPHELCIHCMQLLQNQHTCPHCGQDNRHYKPHPLYLKPYTLLQEQYVIGKSIGQGGFGITYIGLDVWLQKRVAIKEYMPTALATRDFVSAKILPIKQQESAFLQGLTSFLYEARNLAKFDHPHIVHVHNYFEENQTGYMVMDFLEGQSLIDILMQSNGRLTVNQTLDIMLPILDALSEIHAAQIYHRDISPHNIYILTDGTPILIDFGAARHIVGENSRSLDLVLKHGYSPIEQYSGKGKVGAWTDIYACGALMYVMLVGSLPPAATDRFYEDSLVPLKNYPNLNIPEPIVKTIDKALSIKAEHRFQSVATFKAALLGQEVSPEKIVSQSKYPAYFAQTIALLAIAAVLILPIYMFFEHFINNPVPALEKQAKQHLQQQQMVLAAETYYQVFSHDSDSQQARQGLQQIDHYFEQQVQQASEDMQGLTEILAQMDQVLALFSNQTKLIALKQQITDKIKIQNNNEQIKIFLQQAQQYIDNKEYKAAYEQYQFVLELEQNQAVAIQGLDKIEQIFIDQAKNQKTDLKQRLDIIQQALALFPQNTQLITLQQTLTIDQNKQQQIQTLLKTAQKQLNALYLTEPENRNAYATYQQILRLAPNHPNALVGLEKIANAYVKLAKNEKNREKRLQFVQKGLKVVSNHSELLRLKNNLEKTTIAEQPKPVDITPKPQKPDVITTLLSSAQQQMNQQQYELAYQIYQKVLKQQKNHVAALQGLKQISSTYETLAHQQFEQQNFTQANLWLDKGLALFPAHAGLLHLRERLKLALQPTPEPEVVPKVEPEIAPKDPVAEPERNIIFTPSF
ncbi:protein kinase [Candidatus Albibeggiatoa sp. nov. NOAA]|uniref:protein kinase domain-containing protein n=1 Tax=Candidatus Albibeggiatoa sp. nov. NOAA TaxID=3162724 RepID=UPI0032F93820|nr:protein kinase [Thiotrichaceae bacterium]